MGAGQVEALLLAGEDQRDHGRRGDPRPAVREIRCVVVPIGLKVERAVGAVRQREPPSVVAHNLPKARRVDEGPEGGVAH